jgi:hypothetical protein
MSLKERPQLHPIALVQANKQQWSQKTINFVRSTGGTTAGGVLAGAAIGEAENREGRRREREFSYFHFIVRSLDALWPGKACLRADVAPLNRGHSPFPNNSFMVPSLAAQ